MMGKSSWRSRTSGVRNVAGVIDGVAVPDATSVGGRWRPERRGTSQQVGKTKRTLRAVAVAVTLMAVALLAVYAIYRLNIPAAMQGIAP